MRIAVFGGDKRMLFAARAFADEGHEVDIAGFDHLMSLCEIRICDYAEAAEHCDIAVLPVRPTVEGVLNTPCSARKIEISDLMNRLDVKPVFSGFSQQIRSFTSGKVYDYSVEESFTRQNAALTAEGAIGILVSDYEGSISGTDILVNGYGRIGKILSADLKAMGASVTVAARNPLDRDSIRKNGCLSIDYPELDAGAYQVIINTVPALVMDRKTVDRMREDVFIIELASAPGGFDVRRVKERDLSLIHAPGLPGKTAPLAAGRIIKDTITNILSRKGASG